jgi:CheY-like chemotaxis protein
MNAAGDVLVVEDNQDLAEVMMFVLREAGFAARSASNGVEALEAVAAKRPALILLDMLMPIMDGWRCAQELRARYGESLPIVVVSAAEDIGAVKETIGADGALAKPFELPDLMELVGRYVDRSEAGARCERRP